MCLKFALNLLIQFVSKITVSAQKGCLSYAVGVEGHFASPTITLNTIIVMSYSIELKFGK
jgi:hypothetical protein